MRCIFFQNWQITGFRVVGGLYGSTDENEAILGPIQSGQNLTSWRNFVTLFQSSAALACGSFARHSSALVFAISGKYFARDSFTALIYCFSISVTGTSPPKVAHTVFLPDWLGDHQKLKACNFGSTIYTPPHDGTANPRIIRYQGRFTWR